MKDKDHHSQEGEHKAESQRSSKPVSPSRRKDIVEEPDEDYGIPQLTAEEMKDMDER